MFGSYEETKRKLKRLKKLAKVLEKQHKGNEINFTYHAVFSLGFLKGKISILEDLLDEYKENK